MPAVVLTCILYVVALVVEGESKKLISIKQRTLSDDIPAFPEYVIPLMKVIAIELSSYGFTKHFESVKESQQHSMRLFKELSKKIKAGKKFKVIERTINKGILKVKLNPAIWQHIMSA